MNVYMKLNQLPTRTWNWLKINNAELNSEIEVKNGGKPSVSRLPSGVSYEEQGTGISMSLAPVSTGMGENLTSMLDSLDVIPSVLTVAKGVRVPEPVTMHFDLKNGTGSFSRQIIRAEDNAQITVVMDYTSPPSAGGFQAVQTKLYAGKNAYIHLIKVQLLGNDYIHLDDTGTTCDESATVEVTQIELGGKQVYTGVAAALPSFKSAFRSDTAYYCRNGQKLDMNYMVVHTGRNTDCKMNVRGTLKDTAQKTYRGSIDFRNGCSGSTGNEQEETLLLSPDVINKSIPLILCDEEDVAGEHGATIGKLGEDIQFYMNTRGISKAAAEEMMTRAKIQNVTNLIPAHETVIKIHNYMEKAFSHE